MSNARHDADGRLGNPPLYTGVGLCRCRAEPAPAIRAAVTVTYVADRRVAPFNDPDWSAAQGEAMRRCGAWSYASANTTTVVRHERGSDSTLARPYQCVD